MRVTKKLIEKYPFMSPEGLDGREPYALFGIECGGGWEGLLLRAFDTINKIVSGTPAKFYVQQIKEKFGTLRVYWSCADCTDEQWEALNRAVRVAEEASETTCEICGKEGYIDYDVYWLSCWCDECRKERQ